MLVIRAGHPKRVAVVTFGFLRLESGGRVKRELRFTLVIRAGHPKRATVVTLGLLRLEFWGRVQREPRL
eukprot:6255334-Pyramimonas_sp.AAC.1